MVMMVMLMIMKVLMMVMIMKVVMMVMTVMMVNYDGDSEDDCDGKW